MGWKSIQIKEITMLLENNYILITNKFHGENNLYYDLTKNHFFKSQQKIPSGVYILTVLAMAATRSLKYQSVDGNFLLLLLAAIASGILLGCIIQLINKFFKSSQSLKILELSTSEIEECVKNGKKLLSNQLKFLAAACVFLVFICVSFYFNRTWMYFVGITVSSMLVTILFVFINYFNKTKTFSIIEKNRL